MIPSFQPLSVECLQHQRWFASKAKAVAGVRVRDWAPFSGGRAALSLQEVVFADGSGESYFVPLATERAGEGGFPDAFADEVFCLDVFDHIAAGRVVVGQKGLFRFTKLQGMAGPPRAIRRIGVQQSNTSIVYDQQYVLKAFRRLAGGINPELEMGRFLTAAGFDKSPPLVGCVEYVTEGGERESLAVLQAYLPNQGDGWSYLLRRLKDDNAGNVDDLRRLGEVTAELHLALSRDTQDRAFQPEPVSAADLDIWADDILAQISRGSRAAEAAASRTPIERQWLNDLRERQQAHRQAAGALRSLVGFGELTKIRVHGDYHLGQVLRTSEDFAVIDFEGEPARPLSLRRQKQLALRDVAGMLRSLSYLGETALAEAGGPALAGQERHGGPLPDRARAWHAQARSAFLDGYIAKSAGSPIIPHCHLHFERTLAILELEKAYYELEYEANNRPDWLTIPLRYLSRVSS